MTLGELLRNRRVELGKSLEQLSAATKVHVKALKALEENQYSELPARAFARGFLISYCKALKLDSDQVLKDYHDFLESKFAERQSKDQGHQGYVFEGKELEQNRRWLIIGGSIAGVFAIATLLIFKPQNQKRKEKHKDFAPEETPALVAGQEAEVTDAPEAAILAGAPVSSPMNLKADRASPAASVNAVPSFTPSSTPVASVAPKATPSSPKILVTATATPAPQAAVPTATPKEDKLNKGDALLPKEVKRKISLEATEDVWVRYKADDKPVTVLLLRKGRFLVIKGKEKIGFETNNSSALRYRTRGSQYIELDRPNFTVEGDGSLKEGESTLAPNSLPAEIPAARAAPKE